MSPIDFTFNMVALTKRFAANGALPSSNDGTPTVIYSIPRKNDLLDLPESIQELFEPISSVGGSHGHRNVFLRINKFVPGVIVVTFLQKDPHR